MTPLPTPALAGAGGAGGAVTPMQPDLNPTQEQWLCWLHDEPIVFTPAQQAECIAAELTGALWYDQRRGQWNAKTTCTASCGTTYKELAMLNILDWRAQGRTLAIPNTP